MNPSSDTIQGIVHHVFLPPKLPQKADDDSEIALINTTLAALESLRQLLHGTSATALNNAVTLLENIKAINSLPGGKTDETQAKKKLLSLGVGQTLAVKINAQNAAVLITRWQNELIFEEFELSPQNKAVVGTKGRLTRTFPGLAVSVDAHLLDERDFTEMIASTLATMCRQEAPGMQPQSKKAQALHDEHRDTASPAMVSELLFGLLRGIGKSTTVSAVSKHTRDEVLYYNAEAPWRRSPMWLLIRVALQLVSSRSSDGSHELYKGIMIFVMSHILQSTRSVLSTDMLYVMKAKIIGRLQKKSGTVKRVLPDVVFANVNEVLQQVSDTISKRWTTSQQLDSRDLQLPNLTALRFEQDTFVALPLLDDHIVASLSRQHETSSSSFIPSSQLIKYSPGVLPTLPVSNSTDPYYASANLQQFEQWVAKHVDHWVATYTHKDACEKLHSLMTKYHALASSLYASNPEATSVMVLTNFELWVASDKVAVIIDPLVAKFDPGVPSTALENLLLPFVDQMKRLSKLEEHLDRRRSQSVESTDHMFDAKSSNSFASKYFSASAVHQTLLATIKTDAATARQNKLIEFHQVKREYARLDALYDQTSHEYRTVIIDNWCDPPETEQRHAGNCTKCSYETQRDRLQIQVHEWPLPSNVDEARTVIFELLVPSWFGHWRDARFYLLQDVLKGERPRVQAQPKYELSTNDPHLTQKHFQRSTHGRIGLLSESKPVLNTHYRNKNITTLDESQICVENGLRYQYYDATSNAYMKPFTFPHTILLACTYTIPSPVLQRFVFRPASSPDGPEPNVAIASQDSCPANMALDEYKQLTTIPLGRHIQWANILLQLAMPGVDFKRPDTTSVLLQCIYQVGPPSSTRSVLRDSHDMFSDEDKVNCLLNNLRQALQRVKGNWESAQAVRVFASIAARALSLSTFSNVQRACLAFLKSARDISIGWVNELREKAHSAENNADRTQFVSRSVEVALICISTYDVDDHHLPGILDDAGNASILVQNSIIVQEGEHNQTGVKRQYTALLDLRFKRLLHRMYKILANHEAGLDDAIRRSWPSYVPGCTGWSPVSRAADHWLTTNTSAVEGACMTVHYNLLSSELLVNGLALDQPPKKYRTHPLYSTLFGKAVVDVMPTTAPGFQLSTKRTFGGYAVHLGLTTGSSAGDLIVQATKDNSTYETVPCDLINTGYPIHFVQDYVHWYSAATDTVEFRPVDDPWNAFSTAKWTLSRQTGQKLWRLTKAGCSIAGVNSSTSRRVSHVLRPLADYIHIHSILQARGDMLIIDIPTIRLGFSLKRGRSLMMSRESRSMAVDEDQALGTLVGLRSKVVLKSLNGDKRLVLIPESTTAMISYQREDHHIIVTVPKNSIQKVHTLYVDTQLGRLVDNGDVSCKMYLAYLHAVTSSCLIDPLTQRTGTEQALTILNSAAVRSFDQLSQTNIALLTKIAALSPGRCYYPAHERVMQTVDWNGCLSFLSQHGHFVSAVKALLQQGEQLQICFSGAELQFPRLDAVDEHLLQRDNIRSATFRVSTFGAEDHTARDDGQYTARDRNLCSQRAARASILSVLIFRSAVELAEPAAPVGSLWKKMSNFDLISGAPLDERPKVKYDSSLLEGKPDLPKNGQITIMQRLPAFHRWLGSFATSQPNKFSVMMWLSTMVSDSQADMNVLQTIAMFFKSTSLAKVNAPDIGSFEPKHGKSCPRNVVAQVVAAHRRSFETSPEYGLIRRANEKQRSYHNRRHNAWQLASNAVVTRFVDALSIQSQSEIPNTPNVQDMATYIDVSRAMEAARWRFKSWHNNRVLDAYLTTIEQAISSLAVREIQIPMLAASAPPVKTSIQGYATEHSLFLGQPPGLPKSPDSLDLQTTHQEGTSQHKSPLLGSLVMKLEGSAGQSKYKIKYSMHLRRSLDALTRDNSTSHSVNMTLDDLSTYRDDCHEHASKVYELLVAAVRPPPTSSDAQSMHHWPRVSPALILQQLSRTRWEHLSEGWKKRIVQYGHALAALQRADRLVKLASRSRKDDLVKELRNPGHKNWEPMDHPESLLIEVENGIIIREVQEQIAASMRSPPDDRNAVMQLNMGEGKSSVTVPIVAAALANGDRLVRVIVAKPQSRQMAQMLISKFGGLLNRRVYYMPFSRALKLDKRAVVGISHMPHECMRNGGILLVQPEHILSFKLMAPECYITGREDVGRELMSTQDFFDSKTRTLVDESDENFSVHFELIYTMGMQRPMEMMPDRWMLLQHVLDLVRQLAPAIVHDLPLSVDHHPGVPGSFPRLRILRSDAQALLLQRLAEHICANGIEGFQISRQPEAARKAIHTYITKPDLDLAEISAVEDSVVWTETMKSPLLLIRGIIACGILAFALGQKRWRVNYGLASRTPPTKLAVPYRAKDSPSPRSEFSHPDVVLVLTSLCYYYDGLSNDDLFTAMEHLMESDQSDTEYQTWVKDAHNLPTSFHQLQGLNLKDRPQCTSEVFPALRYSKSAIDYFLSHIVFPKEMKEFPHKLSASGWDIGKRKSLPVTGFSGTNDTRCLLPIDVDHLDLPEQKHTNALVLEHILQPSNAIELVDQAPQNTTDAAHFLDTVLRLTPLVQVILDVGAQILELDNLEVAKAWLGLHDPSKQAVVFVNDVDEVCVVDRDGRVDPLRTSSFFTRLDLCLVFLDQAHTRGIDLVLPAHYRAAVLLGASVTKDKLVQACMRMRKLGSGQTIVFCISPEIQDKILESMCRSHSSDITVEDVLIWSISETHTETHRSMPLWVVQGERFVRQERLWNEIHDVSGKTTLSTAHAEKLLEDEAQTIDHRYRPRQSKRQPSRLFDASDPNLQRIADRCREFDNLHFDSSALQEEQERELSPEIEQERQVQRASPAQPAQHSLHADVLAFAQTGQFTAVSPAYMPAFEALRDSSAGKSFNVSQLAGNRRLFVTADFVKTVKQSGGVSFVSDTFQRPVQWLLTSRVLGVYVVDYIMIVSPFEANALHKSMKDSTTVTLHIYKPRCNSGYAPLDQLDLYNISAHMTRLTVPRALVIQLNLFAGQLYIDSREDYHEICKFLGLSTRAVTEQMTEQGWDVAADGFILSDGYGRVGCQSGIMESPVKFFKILMSTIRRNGDGIARTHMGSLLMGKLFQESEFEN